MDRAKWIAACAQSEEDRILLARVYDRYALGERRGICTASCFLSPRERVLAERLLRGAGYESPRFFGGTPEAERTVCVYLPDYLTEEELSGADGPLTAFRAAFHEGDALTHRDFLGSLMGCGIKRETVGDIYVGAASCDFVVLQEIAPYVSQNLLSAGRSRLSLTEIPLAELSVPAAKTRVLSDTVATLRLDSVLSSAFRLSRGKAAALIEAGRVSLNHLPCVKPDKSVEEGDVFSVQGMGKARLASVQGATKKGRISLRLERYE